MKVDVTAAAQLVPSIVDTARPKPLDAGRILVVVTIPLGDTLFASPAIRALRARYPRAHIAALALPSNAAILRRYVEVDEVLVWQYHSRWPTPLDFFRLALTLRSHRFDVCIEMTPIATVFTRLAGIPTRVGLGFRPFWWLLPDRAPDWKQRHAVHHYGELVRPLGVRLSNVKPRLVLTDTDRAGALEFLREHGVCDDHRLVTLHPGASTRLKRWGADRFAELADRLQEHHGLRVVVVGGKSDAVIVHAMLHAMRSVPIVAAGRLGILQTAAIQERAAFHVGNDSGPLHLAAAVGTPTVGLFGPTNVSNFRPIGRGGVALHKPKPCSPCTHFIGGSPVLSKPLCRTCACLDELSVDEVEESCLRRLR